jgi:hypothetical protein
LTNWVEGGSIFLLDIYSADRGLGVTGDDRDRRMWMIL